MKKHNLSMPKKIVAASFAVLLASSAFAFAPSVAHAQTMSSEESVVYELNRDAYGSVQVSVEFDSTGTRLLSYQLYLAKTSDSEVVKKLGSYHVDADVSTTPYEADLSDLDYKIAPCAQLDVFGHGTQVAQFGYEGDEYVFRSDGNLSLKGGAVVTANSEYVSAKLSRIIISNKYVRVLMKRTATDAYKEVEKAIDDIGEVTCTEECKARIDAAKAAYKALPEYEKKLVSNADTIDEALSAYKALLR